MIDFYSEFTVSLPMTVFSLVVAFVVGFVCKKLANANDNQFLRVLQQVKAASENSDDSEPNEEETYSKIDGSRLHTNRIVLVKFRLPVRIKRREDGTWDVHWDEILNAISQLRHLKEKQVDFVGTCGYDREDLTPEERDSLEEALLEFNCHPIFLLKTSREKMYNVFCKGILWPLLHYFSPVDSESFGLEFSSLWQYFNGVSMLFAKKASLVAANEPKCVVWFDDYHLLLCPSFLRKQNPQAKIGLYLHTPFPSSEMFRVLPTRVELMRGMLSADCIGFHTYDYARHFISSCKRVLDLDYRTLRGGILAVDYCGRQCSLRIGHLGMCGERVRDLALSDSVQKHVKRLSKKYGDRKVVLSVTGLGRGSVLKMQAIYEFLRLHPKWVQEVVFVEYIDKFIESAEDKNREQRREAYYREVKKISDSYGEDVIDIISACKSALTYEELIAYYCITDVGLFSNFWDGFARTPFEMTVAQIGKEKPAQLILSEFMSCSRSLAGVIRINPWYLTQVSEGIHTALVMTPVERKVAHDRRFDYVMRYTFSKWALGFTTDLELAAKIDEDKRFFQLGWGSNRRMLFLPKDYIHIRTKEHDFLERFRRAKKRLLVFDYGGTLTEQDAQATSFCSKAPDEDEHEMPRAVKKAIQMLTEDSNTMVGVISGQKKEILQASFNGLDKVILSAEKGAYHRFPGKSDWEICPDITLDWQPVVLDIMRDVSDRTDGSWIDQKDSALVWHFENADPEYGNMQAYELERQIKRVLDQHLICIQRYDHSRILEVLPKSLGKGLAAQRIFKHFFEPLGNQDLNEDDVFIFCCGNDRSDEEMFNIVQTIGEELNPKNTFTCSVGIKPTQAKYYLQDHSEVVGILETLSQYSTKSFHPNVHESALHNLFKQNRVQRSNMNMGLSKSNSWSFGLNQPNQGGNLRSGFGS